jgi:hypothetical protein
MKQRKIHHGLSRHFRAWPFGLDTENSYSVIIDISEVDGIIEW